MDYATWCLDFHLWTSIGTGIFEGHCGFLGLLCNINALCALKLWQGAFPYDPSSKESSAA